MRFRSFSCKRQKEVTKVGYKVFRLMSHIWCLVAFLDESGSEFLRTLLLQLAKFARVILGSTPTSLRWPHWEFCWLVPPQSTPRCRYSSLLLTNRWCFSQKIIVFVVTGSDLLSSFCRPHQRGILTNEHLVDVGPSLLIEVILGCCYGQTAGKDWVARNSSRELMCNLHINSLEEFFNTFISERPHVLTLGQSKHVWPFWPARAGAAAEDFCIDLLHHPLGTGLAKRNVIPCHINYIQLQGALLPAEDRHIHLCAFVQEHPPAVLSLQDLSHLPSPVSSCHIGSISILITAFLGKLWSFLCPWMVPLRAYWQIPGNAVPKAYVYHAPHGRSCAPFVCWYLFVVSSV